MSPLIGSDQLVTGGACLDQELGGAPATMEALGVVAVQAVDILLSYRLSNTVPSCVAHQKLVRAIDIYQGLCPQRIAYWRSLSALAQSVLGKRIPTKVADPSDSSRPGDLLRFAAVCGAATIRVDHCAAYEGLCLALHDCDFVLATDLLGLVTLFRGKREFSTETVRDTFVRQTTSYLGAVTPLSNSADLLWEQMIYQHALKSR